MNYSREVIKEFRELRLMNLELMLAQFGHTAKLIKCSPMDHVLLRGHLVDKMKFLQQKLDQDLPADQEEYHLLDELDF